MSDSTRVFFVTDIHGSELCFRKFLSAARAPSGPDVLIIGGDITGKYVVPVVEGCEGKWTTNFQGKTIEITSQRDLCELEDRCANSGAYAWKCQPETLRSFSTDPHFQDRIAKELRSERLKQWIHLADRWLEGSSRSVFISAGNDDPWYIDELLQASHAMVCPEGKVVALSDSLTMISTGIANRTPWNCPRDFSEEEIATRIERMAQEAGDCEHCIFNLHCPPFGTVLDQAPRLDENLKLTGSLLGVETASVGSKAVRAAIEQYRPVVSLHGHIHESAGFQKIGRTLSINAGSEYTIGRLNAALLDFEGSVLKAFELVKDLD